MRLIDKNTGGVPKNTKDAGIEILNRIYDVFVQIRG
jgi:hypothetical protein